MLALFMACVLDRTGQSSTKTLQTSVADHTTRVRELESVSEDVGRRLGQLEEVTRARGQEEILKMETMDQLRSEVANMRGELDQLRRDYTDFENSGLGFQTDADYRLGYLETRVGAVEKSLGLKPPPAPSAGGDGGAATPPSGAPGAPSTPGTPGGTAGGTPGTTPGTSPADAAPLSNPEDYFTLITQHLQVGNGGAARAVAQRFIQEQPKNDRVPEAWYRIAESYQNEGNAKQAVTAFQDVIDRFPKSTWAPWSMLRQGECFDALGMADKARLFYCDVVKVYGTSKAAKEAKPKCGR